MIPLLAVALLVQGPPSDFPWDAHDPDRFLLMGCRSEVLAQQYRLTQAGREVARIRQERPDAASTWIEQREEYTVEYFLTTWCGREGGDDVFLCGVEPDGGTIVERWRFTVPAGHWVVAHGPTPPLGTPAGDYEPVVTVEGGGSWHTASVRPSPPDPAKTVVYAGPQGPFTAAGVDPEGRQLFLYDHTAKSIVRIVLGVGTPMVETLYDDSAYPELAQVSSLEVRDFGAEGRKLLSRRQRSGQPQSQEIYGVFSDADNDGNLESVAFFDRAAFAASPYGTWPSWQEFWRVE